MVGLIEIYLIAMRFLIIFFKFSKKYSFKIRIVSVKFFMKRNFPIFQSFFFQLGRQHNSTPGKQSQNNIPITRNNPPSHYFVANYDSHLIFGTTSNSAPNSEPYPHSYHHSVNSPELQCLRLNFFFGLSAFMANFALPSKFIFPMRCFP